MEIWHEKEHKLSGIEWSQQSQKDQKVRGKQESLSQESRASRNRISDSRETHDFYKLQDKFILHLEYSVLNIKHICWLQAGRNMNHKRKHVKALKGT